MTISLHGPCLVWTRRSPPGIPSQRPALWRGACWWRTVKALADNGAVHESHPKKTFLRHAETSVPHGLAILPKRERWTALVGRSAEVTSTRGAKAFSGSPHSDVTRHCRWVRSMRGWDTRSRHCNAVCRRGKWSVSGPACSSDPRAATKVLEPVAGKSGSGGKLAVPARCAETDPANLGITLAPSRPAAPPDTPKFAPMARPRPRCQGKVRRGRVRGLGRMCKHDFALDIDRACCHGTHRRRRATPSFCSGGTRCGIKRLAIAPQRLHRRTCTDISNEIRALSFGGTTCVTIRLIVASFRVSWLHMSRRLLNSVLTMEAPEHMGGTLYRSAWESSALPCPPPHREREHVLRHANRCGFALAPPCGGGRRRPCNAPTRFSART